LDNKAVDIIDAWCNHEDYKNSIHFVKITIVIAVFTNTATSE